MHIHTHLCVHTHTYASTPLLEQAPLPWSTKLKMLRERHSHEIETLQTSLYIQQQQLQMALPAIRTLLQAASQSTAHTAAILNKASFTGTHLEGYRTRGGMDCGQRGCKGRALPFSRFCLNREYYGSVWGVVMCVGGRSCVLVKGWSCVCEGRLCV